MKEMPKHYSLVKENPDHFLIHDKRDDKAFPVAKKGLHPATQMHMLRLPKFCGGGDVQKFSSGGVEDGGSDQNWGDEPGAEQDPQFSQTLKGQPVMPQPQPQAPAQPPPQAPQGQPSPQGNIDTSGVSSGYPTLGSFNGAIGQEAKGINQQAQGQMEQNRQMALAQQAHLDLEQHRDAIYQNTMQKYQQQNDDLMSDVANNK